MGLEVIAPLAARLRRDEKVDLVVWLSRLGLPQDLKRLGMTPGIGVCLSGHTHNCLFAPHDTLVMESGSHGSFLGRLDLPIEGVPRRQLPPRPGRGRVGSGPGPGHG